MCRGLALSQLLALVIASILLPIRSSAVRESGSMFPYSALPAGPHTFTPPPPRIPRRNTHPKKYSATPEFDVYSQSWQQLTAPDERSQAGLNLPLFSFLSFGAGPGGPANLRCGGGGFERIFVFLSQSEALICLNKAVNKEICVFMCLMWSLRGAGFKVSQNRVHESLLF